MGIATGLKSAGEADSKYWAGGNVALVSNV